MRKEKMNGLCWLWLSMLVLLIDRITKELAQHYLVAYISQPVIPGFNFTLAYNKGAAFSFLNAASGWQTWLFGSIAVVVSGGILMWLKKLSYNQYGLCIALALIIGGALGNLWDRISLGHVVDFIDVYISHLHWPAFNMADSAICTGAIILMIDAFMKQKNN